MTPLWTLPFTPCADSPDPVFRQDLPGCVLFYAPGYLVVAEREQAAALEDQLAAPQPAHFAAQRLRQSARAAREQWQAVYAVRPFTPLCLTLYTSQRCNLHCSYCFSQDPAGLPEADLDLAFIRQAAGRVAAACRQAGAPFTLVIHGGGEPTQDPRLPEILEQVTRIAADHGLPLFRYLATNGVMSAEQARWAADHFDEIGLSCDGPAAIQNAQRPTRGGGESARCVEQTAAILREAGQIIHVRATITPASAAAMPEIAHYLCRQLGAAEVRIEPVFSAAPVPPDQRLQGSQAEEFCVSFLQARQVARAFNAHWQSSGSRLGEIHGRYCQVYRQVLHLVPGDGVSACFKVNGANQAQALGLDLRDPAGSGCAPDPARTTALQAALLAEDRACQECFNRYHCARGCPDACPLDPHSPSGDLRCAVNRMLSTALLQERAEQLRPALRQHPVVGSAIQGGI